MDADEYAKRSTQGLMDLLAAMLEQNDIDVWEKDPSYPCYWMLCTTHEPQKRIIPVLKMCLDALRSVTRKESIGGIRNLDFQVMLFTPEGKFTCSANGALFDEDGCEIPDSDAFAGLDLS